MKRRSLLSILAGAAAVLAVAAPASAQQAIELHGASQFNDDHAFTKAMVKFEELVKQYYGKPINFVLHKNSELGLEKQYFEYMAQGKAVDYAIVSPAHMSTFSKAAPFIDAPFLFRDLEHWNKVLDADILKPIADEIAQKADVMLIGYAGGGTRNIFVNKPVRNLAEIKGLKVRVQGAPIWSTTFAAAGMAPTVIAYNEVYNAIQNGVIAAGENEAAGVEQMKFYEVAPNLAMTEHAITIRPLCFSGKTFKRLPADLQAAIVKAGKEAGAYGRQIESTEDDAEARRAGEGRQAEAHPLRRPRRDEEAGRSGHGRLRQGDRGRQDPRADQRDQVSRAGRSIGRGRGADPGRGLLLSERRGSMTWASIGAARSVAQADRRVSPVPVVAARGLGRDPHHSGDAADLLALHRLHPALHLDGGDGALPVHLDDHDRRHGRRAREHAFRRRRLAAAGPARRGGVEARRQPLPFWPSRWSSSGPASSSRASPGTASPSWPSCRCG